MYEPVSVRGCKCTRLLALVLRLTVLGLAVLFRGDCDMRRGGSGGTRLIQRVCGLLAGWRMGVAWRRGLRLLRRAASLAHSTAKLVEALRGSRLRGSKLRGSRLRGSKLVLFWHWLGARLVAAL